MSAAGVPSLCRICGQLTASADANANVRAHENVLSCIYLVLQVGTISGGRAVAVQAGPARGGKGVDESKLSKAVG